MTNAHGTHAEQAEALKPTVMPDLVERLRRRQNDFCDCGKEAFPEYSQHADNCLGNAFKEAADEITRLRAEREKMAAALESFADACGEGTEDYLDEEMATVRIGRHTHYALTLGDFRRVRTLLSQVSP